MWRQLCKSLPVSVLLGTDVPELFTFLSRTRFQKKLSMAVFTHFKLKKQQLEPEKNMLEIYILDKANLN